MRLCNFAFFAISLLGVGAPLVPAQATKVEVPLPDAPVATSPERPTSRMDIFAGISFLTVHADVFGYKFSETHNAPILSATYYITKNLGVEGQFTYSSSNATTCFSSAQGGPVVRFFAGSQISIFAHADGGETKMGIRDVQNCAWNPSVAAGGGVDYIFPAIGNHLAFRLIQADYQYVALKYAFFGVSGTTNVNVPRVSTGLTIRLGEIEPPGPKVAKSFECKVNPGEAFAGERVVLAALATGYDFRKPYSIHWKSTGGTVVYPGPAVLLDTAGLAPGSYVATAQLTRGKSSTPIAMCSAPFQVQAAPSLGVQCSADPATVSEGQSTTITAVAASGGNRKLVYSFATSAGQIRANGLTAHLETGVAETITATCRVQDDLGQRAEATTVVTVVRAPVEPAPAASAPVTKIELAIPAEDGQPPEASHTPAWAIGSEGKKIMKGCSLSFESSEGRAMRLDAAATTCLDEIAVTMQQRPGTRLTLVGNHLPSEQQGASLAAERATVSKTFLEEQRGIDASRIDVRTGSSTTRSVETYILMPGVMFDPPPTEQHSETN